MSRPTNAWRKVMAQPGHFTLRVLKAFQKNQGLLLSGALAYYILLSVIPLFTFLLLMLSQVVDEAALLATLRRYIGLIIPGDSAAVLEQVRNILEHREVASWVVLCAMLFFSSLAFSVLESALSIIFIHRVRHKPRPLIVSLILPYVYILLLGVGFLVMTAIASLLQSMSDDQLVLLGRGWSLDRLSVILLHFGACRVCFQLAGRRGVTVLKPLVFGNHLRAKQEDDAGDFEAQQPDNRGRQRAVDDADD